MADSVSLGECSKKFVQQGRSLFEARSVHSVREHGKRARTPLAAFFNIPLIEKREGRLAFPFKKVDSLDRLNVWNTGSGFVLPFARIFFFL
jgi:hypothetical protein